MINIILCEGKTDAIFLSYYINKICGYVEQRKVPNELKKISVTNIKGNESFYWYRKNENDFLAIWGVGGKDNFKNSFNLLLDIILKNKIELAYENIMLVCDRDNNVLDNSFMKNYCDCLEFKNNYITDNIIGTNELGVDYTVKTFLTIIPKKEAGALETVLLNSLKEDSYDGKIVDECKRFVKEIKPYSTRYISTDRLELKA